MQKREIPNLETAPLEPSMKFLSRIMKVMLKSNSIGRTSLSQEANIQYSRLLRHLEWLKKKRLIESVIEDGKIRIKLNGLGREFASAVSLLEPIDIS